MNIFCAWFTLIVLNIQPPVFLMHPNHWGKKWQRMGIWRGRWSLVSVVVVIQQGQAYLCIEYILYNTQSAMYTSTLQNTRKMYYWERTLHSSTYSGRTPSGLHGLHLRTQSTSQTPYGVQRESTMSGYVLLLLLDKGKKCHDPELNTQSLGHQKMPK